MSLLNKVFRVFYDRKEITLSIMFDKNKYYLSFIVDKNTQILSINSIKLVIYTSLTNC